MGWQGHPHWCERHWAPCPRDRKNGLMASVLMMERVLGEIPARVVSAGPMAMDEWVAGQTVPSCCRFGDQIVDLIWEQC